MSSPSTTGIQLETRRPLVAEIVELISSMRFAIALLAMIAIAAIIGTVILLGVITDELVKRYATKRRAVRALAEASETRKG